MKKVYLCGRIAFDARPFNAKVAERLRDVWGFDVYVPHEQAPNNLTSDDIRDGRYDQAKIFEIDFKALSEADVVVVVGRVGVDCAFEIGWAYAKEVPIIHVPGGDKSWETSPMLRPALITKAVLETVATLTIKAAL